MRHDSLTVRIRRALKRPPEYFVRRAIDAAARRVRRPWSHMVPRLLNERALLSALGARDVDGLWAELSRQPFFIDAAARQATAERFVGSYPDARQNLLRAADAILRHEFDLLGSGPQTLGTPLPWHDDFKTGRRWPLAYSADIEYLELERPSDVKVPWELSRCQHFTRLGQAYWLTGDDRYAQEFVAEVSDWIPANPYVRGVNWACAMDVALRAVSWIWGFHFMADAPACRDVGFRASFLRALFLHGEFVATHLERGDVNGNHYLCDGVGLVFLGCFFRRARRATRWLAIGRAIVEQEIFSQTTADGVDFEQSTAYHRLVLEAFLTSYELLRRCGETVPPACWTRLERMCEFVQAYTKPDGRAPLIGDADDGRVQILGAQPINDHRYLLSSAAVVFRRADFKTSAGRCWEETFWLLGPDALDRFHALEADPAPLGSTAFPDGGFYVLRAPGAHLIVDCGEVGMKGRGGHGHNDILSFELFLNGRNLITDCGAFLYTASREWRNTFRSTAFHNTVQIDGEELNRFVGPDALWQLRYDAVPVGAMMTRGGRADVFRGGHRGYERLRSPVSHTRECFLDKTRPRVLVRDCLDGSGEHGVVWRFHLDPAVTAGIDAGDVRLSCDAGTSWLLPNLPAGFELSLEPGWVSPSYGVKVPTTVLVWRASARLPIVGSYLFAESRLASDERTSAVEALSTIQ
jgi:Heparinase II/III-like protein/Heparinase II/III N-terminus